MRTWRPLAALLVACFLLTAHDANAAERNGEISAIDAPITALCEVTGKCKILMGISHSEEPHLADLVADILLVLDAPENRWTHERDRPPATLTLELVDFLRHCRNKVFALKKFILHQCLSKEPAPEVAVVEKPLPWPPERERLMSEYLLRHTGDGSTTLTNPTTVVTHWTDTNSVADALATFQATTLQGRPTLIAAGRVNVSCHYVVDRDGTIYHLMPEDRCARHAVGMNRNALCIENVGGPTHLLTEAQLKADTALIEGMVARHPTIDNMIGHSEYRSFENTFIFSERTSYRSDRDKEPGLAFLARLRADLFERGEEIRASGRCDL